MVLNRLSQNSVSTATKAQRDYRDTTDSLERRETGVTSDGQALSENRVKRDHTGGRVHKGAEENAVRLAHLGWTQLLGSRDLLESLVSSEKREDQVTRASKVSRVNQDPGDIQERMEVPERREIRAIKATKVPVGTRGIPEEEAIQEGMETRGKRDTLAQTVTKEIRVRKDQLETADTRE